MRLELKPMIPKIEPIIDGSYRPFWSVMIPTFNCAQYLGKTLESVLVQDPGADEMQIEVVDDCSTNDDPEKVVREAGKGRISFYRNSSNLGPTRNFNNCLRRSKGKYIHILHGDDYVENCFYSSIRTMITNEPNCGLYGTRSFVMDGNGVLDWISPKFTELKPRGQSTLPYAQINSLMFPGVAFRRDCVEKTGGFDESFGHVADWDMWIRLMFHHGGVLSNCPLAYYRFFDQNDSSRHIRQASNVSERIRAFSGFQQLIPSLCEVTFQRQMSAMALHQYNHFRDSKDNVAALANYAVWKNITPLRQRLMHYLREFKGFVGSRIAFFL